MSHSTYNKLWTEAHEELSDLLSEELPSEPSRPERDRVVFFQRLTTMYVRYVRIFRQLEEAYDQIVHPQKRRLIRGVLDGVMGRVLELKNEMMEKEYSEYHYMDDIIQDMKLTPEDLEIPIPKYFINERRKALQERAAVLSRILEQNEMVEKPKPTATCVPSLEEAVRIVQVSERARQGRLRTSIMREIRDTERQKTEDKDLGEATEQQAAVQIQKVWKGYVQRKRTKQEREEEMIFLGMSMKPGLTQSSPACALAEENKAVRRNRQEEHEEDYWKAQMSIFETLRETEGPEMKELMKDQIRQWFMECHDVTGSFPEYPNEEEGGSATIFADKTPEQLIEELEDNEEEEEVKNTKENKEQKGKGKQENRKGEEEEKEPGLTLLPSAFLPELQNAHKTFTEVWQNRDESKNYSQRYEAELIKEEKRKEIEAEIRPQVDELMRQELANWKLAMEGSKGGKSKPAGKKKKASKSGKKKKKDRDLTADRSVESLYEELVVEGLLKPVDNVKLHDFIGDYSYLGTTLRQTDIEPMPSLSDVRQVLSLCAVLPLGSQVIHEKAPLVKAMLLVGPSGVGKKMLVHAVCQETGANLFDLSPLNLVGKYPGKSGLQMMLHMVFKVARLMQPSVVWIGDAEKMFYKKIPKEEKDLDPKRLKKDLPKILKSIRAEDRVLIIGTTNNPLNADLKSLCKIYTKIILIPRPDYASRFVMWKELIRRNSGVVTSALDLSSLAKISDGYTQGHMLRVVKGILTERRIRQLAKRPLTAAEFVTPLAEIDPVFQDEEEALKSWYAKTPLGKKRARAALGMDGEEDVAAKEVKDDKKKGKK
ncbi:dynein regulatory complex protein 11 isoform X2 [Hemibagrus wyckioides]|uniref:dynein regulatory complex protein 11 isoform X2 n=1 Tax=Hemibagrus wyckioides TaxID=337641 RepID=UPI00266D6600|nr:dynein regulatory complex protein 11 isoform X2 [Hemibagrus wyckioides]